MMQGPNPLIDGENYFSGYAENIKKLKDDPTLVEFDKLCYELFEHQETGRHFIKLVKDRYLIPGLFQKSTPTYQIDVLWQEGFKDAFRMILLAVHSHQQRITAEKQDVRTQQSK